MSKLISIIIPTYKQRGGLSASIDSALQQTYNNIEIIVVDDNNPETEDRKSTESLMKKYVRDSRVIYIRHESNKNGAAARNTGIRASKGEYIAFLDDDDLWEDSKLSEQVKYIEDHPEYDAVYTYILSNGIMSRTIPYEGNALIPLMLNRTRMFTSSLLLTRRSVESIGGFDESFRRHQDYEFLAKFFQAGFKIGCLKKPLTKYTPLGGNSPQGRDLLVLKEKYLGAFDSLLNDLERQEKGIKENIIVSNYALCFYTFIATKNFRLAKETFGNYFWRSPQAFISQIIFMVRGKLYRCLG